MLYTDYPWEAEQGLLQIQPFVCHSHNHPNLQGQNNRHREVQIVDIVLLFLILLNHLQTKSYDF